MPTIPDRTRGSTRCTERCRPLSGSSWRPLRGAAAECWVKRWQRTGSAFSSKRTWSAYWPPAEAEAADVLAGHAGRAVLDAVAEEEGVAGPQPGVEEQLGHEHAGVVVPADAARPAVLQGVHRHPLRRAAGVAVVDGHDSGPRRRGGRARCAATRGPGSSRRAPMRPARGGRACAARRRAGDSSSASSCSRTPEASSERAVGAARGTLRRGPRRVVGLARAAGSGTRPAAAGSPPARARPAATRGAAAAGRPAASSSGSSRPTLTPYRDRWCWTRCSGSPRAAIAARSATWKGPPRRAVSSSAAAAPSAASACCVACGMQGPFCECSRRLVGPFVRGCVGASPAARGAPSHP